MAAYRQVYDFVTCGLTAYDRDQLRAQRSYRVWATFTFTFYLSSDTSEHTPP